MHRRYIFESSLIRYIQEKHNCFQTNSLVLDALAQKDPKVSSADQILPTLIFSIMVSPLDINAISNLVFIQRFRARKLINGEEAYCLTNFEAALSFLENVDFATLLGGEDDKTVTKDKVDTPVTQKMDVITESADASETNPPATPTHSVTTAPGSNKRVSYMAPVEFAQSAASSAVNTADQSLKTIGSTLETSFKFVFGRMSDRKAEIPKTLDEARQLVATPPVSDTPSFLNPPWKSKPTTIDQASVVALPSAETTATTGLMLPSSNTDSSSSPFGFFGSAMQRINSTDSTRSKVSLSGRQISPARKCIAKPEERDGHPTSSSNVTDRNVSNGTPITSAAEGMQKL